MILTITANPSLDFLYEAETLVWDDANRVAPPRRRPGGQGINVARAVRTLGGQATAIAPLGGTVGDDLARCLLAENLPLRTVPIAGVTRVFTGVRVRASGSSLLLNPRGPDISPEEADALERLACSAIVELEPAWVACCGSVPPGLPEDMYARIGAAAHRAGTLFVTDCDNPSLRHAAPHCDLLVPNHHEAGRLLGGEVSEENAAEAAVALLGLGAGYAAITLGAAGAVLATRGETWRATPPALQDGSAVGAGDAFLAALLLALIDKVRPERALRAAVAAGSAVLLGTGDKLLGAEHARLLEPRIAVTRIRTGV